MFLFFFSLLFLDIEWASMRVCLSELNSLSRSRELLTRLTPAERELACPARGICPVGEPIQCGQHSAGLPWWKLYWLRKRPFDKADCSSEWNLMLLRYNASQSAGFQIDPDACSRHQSRETSSSLIRYDHTEAQAHRLPSTPPLDCVSKAHEGGAGQTASLSLGSPPTAWFVLCREHFSFSFCQKQIRLNVCLFWDWRKSNLCFYKDENKSPWTVSLIRYYGQSRRCVRLKSMFLARRSLK